MKKLIQVAPILIVLLGGLLLFERPAYAYADPGTGLLVIQAVGSFLVATGWYMRRKIQALFHRGDAAKKQENESSGIEEDTSPPLS